MRGCVAETWEQRIRRAYEEVDAAERARIKVLTEAREAGLTLRTIADIVDRAPSTVMRQSERPRGRKKQEQLLEEKASV